MKEVFMTVRRTIALFVLATALFAVAGAVAVGARKGDAPPVSRVALAQQVDPVGAAGRTLGLSRVKIQPRARIALHRHPGTQLAYIQRGVLTYSVRTGSVEVMRGAADQSPKVVRRIDAGQTGKIRAGQWIVEQPGTIHRARNASHASVVILLATLFTNGSPPSLPVD
jgi:quercetin dioxygenase-like cupin family protein